MKILKVRDVLTRLEYWLDEALVDCIVSCLRIIHEEAWEIENETINSGDIREKVQREMKFCCLIGRGFPNLIEAWKVI